LEDISRGLQSSGQATSEYGGEMLPASEGWEDSMARSVGGGLGSMVPLIVASILNPAAGIATAGSMGMGEATQRARIAGQGEDTQTQAALLGLAPGLLDYLPVQRLLGNRVVREGLMS